MSSTQRDLTDYIDSGAGQATAGTADERNEAQDAEMPQWQPGAAASNPRDARKCQNCGAHVTERFRAVHGDEDKIAWACPRCPDLARADIIGGNAATHNMWE